MARGDRAKQEIIQKIIEIFGQEKTILVDKKLYVNTKENGEAIQICISFTCPKQAVSLGSSVPNFGAGLDFESMGSATVPPAAPVQAEITEEEKQTIQELMARLGL